MSVGGWVRLHAREKCRVCGHAQWCSYTADNSLVHCMRIASDWACKSGGWFHRLTDAPPSTQARPWHKPPESAPLEAAAIMYPWRSATDPARVGALALMLGVSVASLNRLNAAWATPHGAWAFPMIDGEGRWVGIRLRNEQGEKWAVKGSKSALFIPEQPMGVGPIVIIEGPTDTAAVLDWGFDAIGRPSCNDGQQHLRTWLQKNNGRTRDVVILANRDGEKTRPDGGTFRPGQDGAALLADEIVGLCRTLKVIYPLKGKDARQWKAAGASRQVVDLVIRNARLWRKREAANN